MKQRLLRIINWFKTEHDLLFKAFLAIIAVTAIVYIFPKKPKFKYEFQKTKPWLHEQLIAPFDFPIYKLPEELAKEYEQTNANSHQYFKVKTAVQQEQLNGIQKRLYQLFFEPETASDSTFFKNHKNNDNLYTESNLLATNVLNSVYNKGVLEVVDEIALKNEADFIVVVENGAAQQVEIGNLFTLQQAYDYAQLIIDSSGSNFNFLKVILPNYLSYNILYDRLTTDKILNESLNAISRTQGVVLKNEKIIDRGEVVTEDLYRKLNSLRTEYKARAGRDSSVYLITFGQFLLVGAALLTLMLFLSIYRKELLQHNSKIAFVLILVVGSVYLASVSVYFETIPIYVLPFCVLPIIIRSFYDVRLATFIHIITMIIIGFIAPNGFEFVFLQVVTGVLSSFSLINLRKRSQLLTTSLVIFIAYSFIYLAYSIIQEGNIETINWTNITWFGLSALLTLSAYPLVFIFEKIFGFLSELSLLELSDTNSPLLRELANKAPGTFQHSLQVANLAEQAVLLVGGDPLLVRTGALYHDIGKMQNPAYFIENQVRGINPHDDLPYEKSASIIINHVIHGIELAKKNNLPETLIDFIRTHHGSSRVEYFYRMALNENPATVAENYTYPGPIPYSKETAILMMADSVEAASRSLKSYTTETITNLVEGIINKQASNEQFVNSNITFRDISKIKKLFIRMLVNIYHIRIEYPK